MKQSFPPISRVHVESAYCRSTCHVSPSNGAATNSRRTRPPRDQKQTTAVSGIDETSFYHKKSPLFRQTIHETAVPLSKILPDAGADSNSSKASANRLTSAPSHVPVRQIQADRALRPFDAVVWLVAGQLACFTRASLRRSHRLGVFVAAWRRRFNLS